MITRHSLNILSSRFSLVYKSLLFLIIVTLLIAAIAVSALYPTLSPLFQEFNEIHLFKHIGNAFSSIFSGDMAHQNASFLQLKADYHSVLAAISDNTALMWLAVGLLFLFYFLYKFLSTTCHLPISDVTNHFMMSNSKFGFTSNFILNIKSSLKYSLLHTLILIPLTAITVGVVWLTAFLISKVSIFLMAMMVYLIVILLFSIKRALFAYWLPTIVVEKVSAVQALKTNFKLLKGSFAYNFGFYFMIYLLIAAITLLFTLATLGIGLIIAGAITTVFFKVADMVIYYRKNRLKYYVDSDTVVNSKNAVSDGFCE